MSPAFVVMFVMQQERLSWEEALHMVQNRRYCISPNGGFLTQLKVSFSPLHPTFEAHGIRNMRPYTVPAMP